MTLLQKAEKAAKKKGVKIPYDVKIGLKAVQRMHDISKKYKGSAYDMYMKSKKS